MSTTYQTNLSEAADGRRIVSVRFRLQSEQSDAPMVIQTFRLYTPDDFSIKAGTQALIPITCVRDDTYEVISLSDEEFESALDSAVTIAAGHDPDW